MQDESPWKKYRKSLVAGITFISKINMAILLLLLTYDNDNKYSKKNLSISTSVCAKVVEHNRQIALQ